MMVNIIKVNGEWLPKPEGDLDYTDEKVKNEMESEAGTILAQVIRVSRLQVSGKWNLSGDWIGKFRSWRNADTVEVEVYYPNEWELTAHTCQFEITGERHITDARKQLPNKGGLYEVSVDIKEI